MAVVQRHTLKCAGHVLQGSEVQEQTFEQQAGFDTQGSSRVVHENPVYAGDAAYARERAPTTGGQALPTPKKFLTSTAKECCMHMRLLKAW